MKILHLPENIASIPSLTVHALNQLEGVVAKNITFGIHKYQSLSDDAIIFPPRISIKRNPIKWLYSKWKFRTELKKWIKWADVLHYMWGPALNNGLDLKWARDKGKTIIIEWVGSEIRNPEILFKINPYYSEVFKNGYEYKKLEKSNRKNKIQQLFYKAGASVCISAEISLYLNKKLFPEYHILNQRLNLKDFIPRYPSIENKRPLIIHSPSAKFAKGTNVISPIIEELKKEFDFEFVLLHDMAREKVLEIMQRADIFLDQIICGGYGMACTEAMAFGKPVMCYIMPEVFEAGLSEDFPVINTNPDNLKEQLIKLITNPQLRHDTGKKSRVYAEENFDSNKIALQLLSIYKEASAKKENK